MEMGGGSGLWSGGVAGFDEPGGRVFVGGVVWSAGVFLLLSRVPEGSRWLAPAKVLGQASGSIFAFHTPFMLQPLLIFQFKAQVPQYANVAISVSVTLALCVVVHKVLHRFEALRWLRV